MSTATPEDWAAMVPYNQAIDQAQRRVRRLSAAYDHLAGAAAELRNDESALYEQVRTLLFNTRAEKHEAEAAAEQAGKDANAEWQRRTGRK